MRLINADALIRELTSIKATFVSGNGLVEGGIEIAISTTNAQPTVDAVEVVQCKDCKHWDGVPADETQDHECHLFDGNEEKIRIATPSDWFCPMGERRTDDVQKTD